MKNLYVLCLLIFSQASLSFAQNGYLYQAAFDGTNYVYGYHSSPIISVTDAPEDTDWDRWSILYDGEVYRLYFMPIGKSDRLYQFGYNSRTNAYEYGFKSTPIIPVVDLPEDANVMSFSMLFDGSNYRLYFKTSLNDMIYQCAYDPTFSENGAYRYGFNSIPAIPIYDAPDNTNWKSWSMLHDGNVYRLYFKSTSNENELLQFGFDGEGYTYGYKSIPVIKVLEMPNLDFTKKFNITHDGNDYRYYNLFKPR